jgi:hypothetical protein
MALLDLELHIINNASINMDWQNKVLLNTISTRSREPKSMEDFPVFNNETVEKIKKRIPIIRHIKHLGSKIQLYQEKKRQDHDIEKVDKDVPNSGSLKTRNNNTDINFDSRQDKDSKFNERDLPLPGGNEGLRRSGLYTGTEKGQGKDFPEHSGKQLTPTVSSSDEQAANTTSWSKRIYFQRATKSGLGKLVPNTLDGSHWMDMDSFDIESDYMSEQGLDFGS